MPRYRPGASRQTVSSRSGAISENAVVYSSSGGHNHDGANSSLIDVNKYSLWDFTLNTIYSTNDRTSKQNSHIEQFRNYVKNIIINDAFGAAGVTLGDNVINANNIIAGSISTDLLRTDAIKSTNYSYTSGNFSTAGTFLNLSDGSIISKDFFIDSSGNAGITGTINANAGYLGSSTSGFDISSNSITSQDFVAGGDSGDPTSPGSDGRGKLNLYSYGDIVIDSSPTSGNHSGQTYKTSIVGEYLYIEKTSSGDKPQILIGNTNGNTDAATVQISQSGNSRASMYMSSGAGNLALRDSSDDLKVNLVGSTGVIAGRTLQAYDGSGTLTSDLVGSTGFLRAGGTYSRTNTGAYNFVNVDASGNFYGQASSSIRVKRDVEEIPYGLDSVMAMRAVRFEYKSSEPGQKDIGFIAEEFLEIVPEACHFDLDDPDYIPGINYPHIISVAVKAIQELKAEVDELREQLSSLS